jgi:hypothetical protein
LALSELQTIDDEERENEHCVWSATVSDENMQSTLHRISVDQFKAQLMARALYVFHNEDN